MPYAFRENGIRNQNNPPAAPSPSPHKFFSAFSPLYQIERGQGVSY